jgi:Lon protease-like protein
VAVELRSDFPLFPLGLVALPGELVPLHIFEERYLTMIEECLEHHGEFGILWLAEDELKSVGCACEISRVVERGKDGRMNILALGKCPFRLIERQNELAYPAGRVELLIDEPEDVDSHVAKTAREVYCELVEQATENPVSSSDLQSMSAYNIAGTVDFGSDAKQELLELRSENARLRLLTLLLRAAIKRLELIDRAQSRARSNGKVRYG